MPWVGEALCENPFCNVREAGFYGVNTTGYQGVWLQDCGGLRCGVIPPIEAEGGPYPMPYPILITGEPESHRH